MKNCGMKDIEIWLKQVQEDESTKKDEKTLQT